MSIVNRSFIAIIANIVKALLTFLTGILIARGLGAYEFGIFSFLLASFISLRSLLDMGASNAFFTFISRREKSKRFFLYYFAWMALQFFLTVTVIYLIMPNVWIEYIWHGETLERILLAFSVIFFRQHVWNMIAQIGESQRQTYIVQKLSVLVALIHFIVVVVMFWSDILTIEMLYSLVIFEFLIFSAIAFRVVPVNFINKTEGARSIFIQYKNYCLPLIPYLWLGVVMTFLDTWLLQSYGGPIEQAYYAIAAQFASVSLIATTSVLKILWKEIAEANENNDHKNVFILYHKTYHILFAISVIISGFILPWTDEIIQFLLGHEYENGAIAMMLMFFYPIHQSLGQIQGTMYFALGYTRSYVVINSFFMLVGIIMVYIMLAPTDSTIPGLGLGSTGLALKMVCIQVFGVNALMWWLSRKQGWDYKWLFQITYIGIFVSIGFILHAFINILIEDSANFLIRVSVASILYFGIVTLILYRMPSILGMKREEINSYLLKLSNFFTRAQ